MNTEQYPIEQYSFDAGDCQPIDTPTPPVGEVKSAEAEKISFTGKSKDDIMQIVNPDKNGMFWTDAMVKECMGMWAMVVIDSTPHKEGYSVDGWVRVEKRFFIDEMRELIRQVNDKEISLSKMVELLNDKK